MVDEMTGISVPNHSPHLYHIDNKSGKKIFYTKKEGLPDFPWKDPNETHNVPRGRVNDFCSHCRMVPDEEFEEMSIRGSTICNYWQCLCN